MVRCHMGHEMTRMREDGHTLVPADPDEPGEIYWCNDPDHGGFSVVTTNPPMPEELEAAPVTPEPEPSPARDEFAGLEEFLRNPTASISDAPRMNYLILADHAEIGAGGKVSMIGGIFNGTWSAVNPAQSEFCVIIGVMIPWTATNRPIEVEVAIEGEDGNRIADMGMRMVAGRSPFAQYGDAQQMTYVTPKFNITWPAYGLYVAVGRIDGREDWRYPIRVQPGAPGQSIPGILQ